MQKKTFAGVAFAAATLTLTPPAQAASIVTNGGFETGDFTGWTGTGDTTFNGVQCPGPGPAVQAGNCSAFFGPVGTTGGIQQTLSTVAGQAYAISFWLQADGGSPSSFSASFDGTVLTSLINPLGSFLGPFTFYNYSAVATTSSTVLAFSFRDDPGFLSFDSVAVSEVPEPGTWAMMLLGLGAVGLVIRRNRKVRAHAALA